MLVNTKLLHLSDQKKKKKKYAREIQAEWKTVKTVSAPLLRSINRTVPV